MNLNRQTPIGLKALEARIKEDLSWLNVPLKPWMKPYKHPDYETIDVGIIGAGMAGLTAAFALYLKGVDAQLFDQRKEGREGPWREPARMETLRSPKEVVGPVLASPALSFQAWFRAQLGDGAWAQLDKIPRLQWADYLDWYRQITAANVLNEYALFDLSVELNGVILSFNTHAGVKKIFARRLILALGMEAFSGHNIPDFIADIPKSKWIHSYDVYDYHQLKGKNIAVIGASAGAMDSAGAALEAGAASVELLFRADDFTRVNRGKQAGNAGLHCGYKHLSDDQKWHMSHYMACSRTPPPQGSTLRVSRHKNAHFNFGCAIEKIESKENNLLIHTPKGALQTDFIILATGYALNWSLDKTYDSITDKILKWGDIYTPKEEEKNTALAQYPYLTDNFAFMEKEQGVLSGLKNVYCFNYPAILSLGSVIGLINGVNQGASKMAEDIVGTLYAEDIDWHTQSYKNSADQELIGDEWIPAKPFNTR